MTEMKSTIKKIEHKLDSETADTVDKLKTKNKMLMTQKKQLNDTVTRLTKQLEHNMNQTNGMDETVLML